ncbi:hypothetical protein [Methanoregula sp.]|uniref:hypothetical protein n=1 Tax=Methanoregula sp. TaxID=2052170 RepID=UPI0035639804
MAQKKRSAGAFPLLCIIVLILVAASMVSSGCIKKIQKSSEPAVQTTNGSTHSPGNETLEFPMATTSQSAPSQTPVRMTPSKSEIVLEVTPVLTPDPYPIQHATRINGTSEINPLWREPEFQKKYHLAGNATGLLVNVVEGPLYIVYTVTPQKDCLKNPESCRGTIKVPVNRPYLTITVRDNTTQQVIAEDGYGREYSSDIGKYAISISSKNAEGSTNTDTSTPGPRYIPIYREGSFQITIEGNYLDTDISIITGTSPNPRQKGMEPGKKT